MNILPPDCIPCITRMALATSRLAGLDDAGTDGVMQWTLAQLAGPWHALTGPQIATAITEHINGHDGADADAYAALKSHSTQTLLKELPRLEAYAADDDDPLRGALRVAAAGNIIDFGAKDHTNVDLDAELELIPHLELAGSGVERLRAVLPKAQLLLYIGDNAGEIVCDRVCISSLKWLYPGCAVVFAVRGTPVLNDVVMADAEEAGMNDLVPVVSSGSRYPGTVLEETNTSFRELFSQADVIIAKGQGNYETLAQRDDPRVVHVLRIKCGYVSRRTGLPEGTLAVV